MWFIVKCRKRVLRKIEKTDPLFNFGPNILTDTQLVTRFRLGKTDAHRNVSFMDSYSRHKGKALETVLKRLCMTLYRTR